LGGKYGGEPGSKERGRERKYMKGVGFNGVDATLSYTEISEGGQKKR